jgi:hypothetical protein
MPCLLVLLALISPRLALLALWLFSNMLDRAYEGWLLPVLGFSSCRGRRSRTR